MTTETERALPASGSSGGEGEATTTHTHETSESSTMNRCRGRGLDGHVGICGNQGCGGRGGRLSRPAYTSSI